MKRSLIILCIMSSIPLSTTDLWGSDFKSGERVSINQPVADDLYVAGGEIYVLAVIYGDLIATGGEISVEDSILQDLVVAGGELVISGVVGDDIRAAGGRIRISNHVSGDVVVFGGDIVIEEGAIIAGDLMAFGGQVDLHGTVRGRIKMAGGDLFVDGIAENSMEIQAGKVEIDGQVRGTSIIKAGELFLGERARFYEQVEYWTEDGEVDFGSALVNTTAIFNPDFEPEVKNRWAIGLAFSLLGFIYFLTILLILIVFNFLLKQPLAGAGAKLHAEPAKALGYGMLYFIGMPLVGILLLITVIGIPFGLLLLAIFLFSVVFGLSLTAVIVARVIQVRYNYQHWGIWMLVVVSAGVFLVLKVLTLIPLIGWLIYVMLVAMAFGAFLSYLMREPLPTVAK